MPNRLWPLDGLRRSSHGRRILLALAISLLGAAAWTPSQAVPPGRYDIRIEMLNLGEYLQYAKPQHERRCIRDHDVSGFFPILRHQSLNGCELGRSSRRSGVTYYPLVCAGAQETTGSARLSADMDSVEGVLKIQMAGKNMNFAQSIDAQRLGDCDPQR